MTPSAAELHRVIALAGALTAFGIVVIFAGHGMGPVAYLMVAGSPDAWLTGQVLGWSGVLACFGAAFLRSTAYVGGRFWAVTVLVLAAGAFATHSDAIGVSIVTALPLGGLWTYYFVRYAPALRTGVAGPLAPPAQIVGALALLALTLVGQAVLLAPVVTTEGTALPEVLEAVQFVALLILGVETARRASWARWGILIIIAGNRSYYARDTFAALHEATGRDWAIGVAWLIVDVAVLCLLFTRSASAWLSGAPRVVPDSSVA